MRSLTLLTAALLTLGTASARTQDTTADAGMFGRWSSPSGGVLTVTHCADQVCIHVIGVVRTAPGTVDTHNPDTSLRTRPLCGLEIGREFHLTNPTHAEGGTLYDPTDGKTYKGTLTYEKDHLKLRGYVGIKAFGRTETWTRAPATADLGLCAKG